VDGVVWLMQQPLPGAVEAIRRLVEAAIPYAFVTNNSFRPVSTQENALEEAGIPARGKVLTSSMAAAEAVNRGSRVLVGAGPGVVDAITSRVDASVELVEDRPEGRFDFVVVGFHRHFDFDGLHVLSRAVREGARFIATNDDATYPTPGGPIPGGGSIVAAVSTASGVEPEIAGKPHAPMASLVRRHFPEVDLTEAWMIGDRLSTDGAFARRLGCRFARVRSNVSEPLGQVEVAIQRETLADVVDEILQG
jgi:4-nitrophenyl phosphatase